MRNTPRGDSHAIVNDDDNDLSPRNLPRADTLANLEGKGIDTR